MNATDDELSELWNTTNFKKPEVFRGMWGERIFFTLRDDASILFFLSSTKVQVNPGKEKKSKEDSYITVAVPRKYCKIIRHSNEKYWKIDEVITPLTTSCSTASEQEKFVREKICSYYDNLK